MSQEDIDDFLNINTNHHQKSKVKDILKRISGSAERDELKELLGEKATIINRKTIVGT